MDETRSQMSRAEYERGRQSSTGTIRVGGSLLKFVWIPLICETIQKKKTEAGDRAVNGGACSGAVVSRRIDVLSCRERRREAESTKKKKVNNVLSSLSSSFSVSRSRSCWLALRLLCVCV